MVIPISRFAAGPVKDATKRTTRSPTLVARDGLELWGSRTGVTSSYSYHSGTSCAACRRCPLCHPRASVVRWIGGLCYDL